MTGMTPEREAFLRTAKDAGRLLDEVERLRAGIERLHRPVEIEPSSTICGHCSWRLPSGRYFGQVIEWPCETANLLNPTEGETDAKATRKAFTNAAQEIMSQINDAEKEENNE